MARDLSLASGSTGVAAAAFAIVVSTGAHGRAQDAARASVRLDYTRSADAEACPDAAAVQASVVARLGYDPFLPEASTTVRARIRRRGRALTAAVDLVRDGTAVGTRTLESRKSDCEELAQAMSLAITLAIDPQAALRAEPAIAPAQPVDPGAGPVSPGPPEPGAGGGGAGVPAAVAPPAPAPAPPPVAPRRDAIGRPSGRLVPPPPAPGARIAPIVAAGAGVAAGVVPAWTPAISVRGGAALGRARLSLEGRWHAPQETGGGGALVRASLLELALLPCWRAFRGPSLELCALGTVGSLRGQGEAAVASRSDATAFASAGARVGIAVRIGGPIEALALGELGAVLTPTDLEISQRAVWEGSPVRGGIGVQLALDVR